MYACSIFYKCGKIKYMKKSIKSVFVVLLALVFGLSLNYLYGAYGPTTPAPGLPSDLPVITEIYKTDNITSYWQEIGPAPAGGGITGSLLDVSALLKTENVLFFKDLLVGTPNTPGSLSINALTPNATEQNVCSITSSITSKGKIILCDQTPETPTVSISFGNTTNNTCSADPGNVTVVVTNPTSSPMSIKYKKYEIGHDVYTNIDYNYQHLHSWVTEVVNTSQNPYVFTTPARTSCFLTYRTVMLVEVTIDGQLYIDQAGLEVVRGTLGQSNPCEHCDPGAPNNTEGGLN